VPYECEFTITAEYGTVNYSFATAAAAGGTDITISPSSGTLAENTSQTITVTMDLPATYITVSPGGEVQFTWEHGHTD
jgi:plastocyanin